MDFRTYPSVTAIERLPEEIKAKLQESGDQLFLENQMVLLEALVKHWRGEVLSVSVTRLAEKCKLSIRYL